MTCIHPNLATTTEQHDSLVPVIQPVDIILQVNKSTNIYGEILLIIINPYFLNDNFLATSVPEEAPGLSISIQFRQPEVMFFTDLTKSEGHALLLRTELLIDYSAHSNCESLVISLAGLQVST